MTDAKPTLCIGDTHGHLDRLEALLLQEGIIRDCVDSGPVRVNKDVEVVQLGDLGHYGSDTKARDRSIWAQAPAWLDVILWGNHDRAVFEPQHFFGGYSEPFPETKEMIKRASEEGDPNRNGVGNKLKLAHEAHGYLLTHAGLHAFFSHQDVDEELKTDPWELAQWLNVNDREGNRWPTFLPIRDNVSISRQGRATAGGILWRDASESLYKGFPQVFGHSAKPKVRQYQCKTHTSYCVDVGNQFNGRLAGIWLPEMRIVEVELEKDQATRDAEAEARVKAEELTRSMRDDPFWDDDGPWRQLVV